MTNPTPFEEIVKEFRNLIADGTLTEMDYGCDGASDECCGCCGGTSLSESAVTKFVLSKLASVHDSALEKAREAVEKTFDRPGSWPDPLYEVSKEEVLEALDQLRINQ